MSQLVDEAIFESEVLTDVKSEQIRIIFASTAPSLITILLCSFILSLVQWAVIDHAIIVTWFVLTNLLSWCGFTCTINSGSYRQKNWSTTVDTRGRSTPVLLPVLPGVPRVYYYLRSKAWSTRFFWPL